MRPLQEIVAGFLLGRGVVTIKVNGDFGKLGDRIDAIVAERTKKAAALALNDVARAARTAVQDEMRSVFAGPTQFTLNSVRYAKADAGKAVKDQSSRVYINDWYANTTTPPAKYLLAEELGGSRANKRSENALQSKGLIQAGQQTTPAGRPLSGGQMQQLLSSIGALGEQGYTSNASDATRKRNRRKKALMSKQTGTPFFVAKSKLTEGAMGVFKVVATGRVVPILWFVTKRPNYSARLHFKETVQACARSTFARAFQRALKYVSK